ncbi:MAG: peptidylprolyl isomerase [Lutibacter sp.]|uniref:peptidylprolyl isomerase n=1 Tax=Lutibacter sp. TaxID=1925666 RepID=UPI0019EC6917|nr:peptidylprolyl isomerase [Lutibacter sp.]NOR28815.1 peptidylprolyl isomerase [Lutibacter sp.]
MRKNSIGLIFLLFFIGINAQDSLNVSTTNFKKIKLDGVAVVVGKNIVLDSDIDKFKKELQQRVEGKIDITDCEMLEELMLQKLIAHHAVVDSIVASDAEVNGEVERNVAYFTQQLGTIEKVVEMYGFNDEEDLRKELFEIQKEQILIRLERASITEKVDVTPEEVRTYFKNLEKENSLPEFSAEIELAQIVKIVKPSEKEVNRVIEKLNEIKKEIEEGYSFRLKAIINSDDPAVSGSGEGSGGKYTITRESGFIKEFKEVAFSLDEGEISEPFESGFGYHVIQVEKIKGQERDVRHILIQPKISDEELKASNVELAKIREQILSKEITFEEAVSKYSEDKDTKNNQGLILNPQTNDTKFNLTRMDPTLYGRVSNLKAGEITSVFYDEIRGAEKMHKIILLKSKEEAHIASFTQDYEKIQKLTLQKKQEETVDKWAKDKIKDTYIKIHNEFKKCEFKSNWKKD